jgi:hypothetical protein
LQQNSFNLLEQEDFHLQWLWPMPPGCSHNPRAAEIGFSARLRDGFPVFELSSILA